MSEDPRAVRAMQDRISILTHALARIAEHDGTPAAATAQAALNRARAICQWCGQQSNRRTCQCGAKRW